MNCMNGWTAAALIVAIVPLTGCQRRGSKHEMIHPAKVEEIEGSKVKRVTLTGYGSAPLQRGKTISAGKMLSVELDVKK